MTTADRRRRESTCSSDSRQRPEAGMAPQATEALTHGTEGAARHLRASSLIAHALSFVIQLHLGAPWFVGP
jgi:hypothetical protein